MGKLLQNAIEEAQKLPETDQEAIGAWLLAEIESERHWDALSSQPSAIVERMADEALEEYEAGVTKPLDTDVP